MNLLKNSIFARFSKKVKIIGIAVIACILVTAVILLCFFAAPPKKSSFLYLKDRELYFADINNNTSYKVTSELIDLENLIDDSIYDEKFGAVEYNLRRYCKISDDGEILFFIDKITDLENGVPLYYRYLNNPNNEPQLIDSEVIDYVVSQTGRQITYLSGEESALYQHNLKKKTKIDTDVFRFVASPDGKKVIYLKNDEIYIKIADKQPQKLANATSDLYCDNNDFNSIYFKENDILYKIEDGEKVRKIASGVGEIVKYYPTGEIYYLKENELVISLADYLIDDAKSLDESIQEPEYLSYPARWDYETDAEYQKAVEEFEKSYEVNEQAEELWSQKQNRDIIRQDAEYETLTHYYSSLCYYDGKKEKVLNENLTILEYSTMSEDIPTLIFRSVDYKQLKKVRISQVASIEELRGKLRAGLQELSVTHLAVKDVTSVIGFNEYRNYYITDNGKTVYFIESIDDANTIGNLYKMKIAGKKPRKPKLYDKDVMFDTPIISGNKLFYFKNYDNGLGEFYSETKKIADNVLLNRFSYLEGMDSCVYISNWSSEEISGDLFIYENGKSKKIDQNVNSFSIDESGVVLFFKEYDFDFSAGELYAYNDGESQKIDEDVASVIEQIYLDSISVFNENLLTN